MTGPSPQDLLAETARLAYHFHWPLDTILDLEHRDRRVFLAEAGRWGRERVDVRRILAPASRGERRSAVARRHRLGPRVLAAREPKLLRVSTRLAAARMRVPVAAVAPREVTGNYSRFLPERAAPMIVPRAPEPAVAPPPVQVAPSPEPVATSPSAPAVTPESLGIGPASFEWLFGDPEKALAHPDVTPGPIASLPQLSPAERSARRLARLTARGGSAYGRGARISEGPAPARELSPEPAAPEARSSAAREPEAPAAMLQRAPRETVAPPTVRQPQATPQPVATPEPQVTREPEATPDPRAAAPDPAARPARQRLVAGRRPAAMPARLLARAIDPAAPGPSPAAPAMTPAVEPPKPPPPPSPGPPPVRPIARPAATRPQIVRHPPAPPAQLARPAVQRAPRPAPARASLLRRAIRALTPAQDFGDSASTYVAPAPSAMAAVSPPPQFSPQPRLWASAERSSQPLTRAPAGPQAEPTVTARPEASDPDAAYRDLLSRVREEREQLGQLISHPF
jgi:hypothetical protein